MKYIDGLNLLDQLKDYVKTSLSMNVHKIEPTENQIRDACSLVKKMEEVESDENTETIEDNANFDLFDVKQEISDEGDKLLGAGGSYLFDRF